MMKNFTLFLFLSTSIGITKAQTWQTISLYETTNNLKNRSYDAVLGENNIIYVAHPGYTTEVNKTAVSNVISVLKYENNQWDSLPNASNYYTSSSYALPADMNLLNLKLAYANHALYLFYSSQGQYRVKKFKNNQWFDIQDSTSFSAQYFMNSSVIYTVNDNIICIGEGFVFKLNTVTDSIFGAPLHTDAILQHGAGVSDRYAYSIKRVNAPGSDFHWKEYIISYDIQTGMYKTEYQIPESFYLQYGNPLDLRFRPIVNSNGELFLIAMKINTSSVNSGLYPFTNQSDNFWVFKFENQSLNLLNSMKLVGFPLTNENSINITPDGQIVLMYLDTLFRLNAMSFDGQNWNVLGNTNFYEKTRNVSKVFFNSNNEPYVFFTDLFASFPVIANLNRSVSVETPTVSSFSVFPNPSSGIFNIHTTENAEDISYQVYALDGRKIVEKTNVSTPFSLDISNASNGVYVLKVLNGGKTSSVKLLKN